MEDFCFMEIDASSIDVNNPHAMEAHNKNRIS